MSRDQSEKINEERQRRADDIAVVLHKTFTAQATERQAHEALEFIRRMCFPDDCPATAGNFETNRVLYLNGRQAVWREIEAAMKPNQ